MISLAEKIGGEDILSGRTGRINMLENRDGQWYSETPAEIRGAIAEYSEGQYPADHFGEPICACGATRFRLELDEHQGAAIRACTACGLEHAIGDSGEYIKAADLESCFCLCESDEFELSIGIAIYEGTEDVRWLYLGCRCVKCGLTGVYGDWKNEYPDYKELLAHV